MFGFGADVVEGLLVEKVAIEFDLKPGEAEFDKAVEEVRKRFEER